MTCVLLVLSLLWVPVVVRAAQQVDGGSSMTLRLNRGFDLPVERQSAPAMEIATVLSDAVVMDEAAVAPVHAPVANDESLPRYPHTLSPDPLRGPPVSVLG